MSHRHPASAPLSTSWVLSLSLSAVGTLALGGLFIAQPIAVAGAAEPSAASGPKATLQRLNGNVDKQLRQKVVAGSPEEAKVKAAVKQYAGELLDYGELCKRALGEHWDKMAVPVREDFVQTLRELIERNYIKQLRTNLDYEVTYGDETFEGEEARVSTTIKIATHGKSTSALIEYRLLKKVDAPGKPFRWMVYDVITDELSLVRNYRSQFTRIIGSSGYDGLLAKMKTKLAEEKAKDAPAGAKPAAEAAPAAAPAATPAPAAPAGKAAPAAPAGKPATPPAAKPATPAAKPATPAAKPAAAAPAKAAPAPK
jgi:phospholipid transport system substrate-binding protein